MTRRRPGWSERVDPLRSLMPVHACSCILMRSRRSFQFVVIRGSKQTCDHASVAGRTVDRPPGSSPSLPSKSTELPDGRAVVTPRALEPPVAGFRFHRGGERCRKQTKHDVADPHAVRLPPRSSRLVEHFGRVTIQSHGGYRARCRSRSGFAGMTHSSIRRSGRPACPKIDPEPESGDANSNACSS